MKNRTTLSTLRYTAKKAVPRRLVCKCGSQVELGNYIYKCQSGHENKTLAELVRFIDIN